MRLRVFVVRSETFVHRKKHCQRHANGRVSAINVNANGRVRGVAGRSKRMSKSTIKEIKGMNNGKAESIIEQRLAAMPLPRTPDQDEAYWILRGVMMYMQGYRSAVSFTREWWGKC